MFEWNGQDCTTYGKLGAALCALTSRLEAARFWRAYVAYLSRPDAELCGKTPEEVAASNIGYLMGYYGSEERQRVYGLFAPFNVAHPIFGKHEPAPDEAFAAGQAWAAGGMKVKAGKWEDRFADPGYGPFAVEQPLPVSEQCAICGRLVADDPLVIGPMWCQRCMRDELDRA